MDVSRISSNKMKNITTSEVTELKSFWEKQTSVIIFFRRWGCMFCRMWAVEVSEIQPILKKHNVSLIGVGVEEFGFQEFKDGQFFNGDLYIDTERATYNALGFKRFNLLSVLASLTWKESRLAIGKGRKMGKGVQGNLKGDGLQNGGALIVEKGGKVLRHFVQVGPAENLSNVEILKVLGLESEIPKLKEQQNSQFEKRAAGESQVVSEQPQVNSAAASLGTGDCNTETCPIPAK